MMNPAGKPSIAVDRTEDGYALIFRARSYPVAYPKEVWNSVPERERDLLTDNLAYAATMHLPMKMPGLSGLSYMTTRPLFEPYFRHNMLQDIPSCCDVDGSDIGLGIERFLGLEYSFASDDIRRPGTWPLPSSRPAGAIVPLTFGKDSLLTFALAEELGLRPKGAFVDEPSFGRERHHKEILSRRMKDEFGHELVIVDHQSGMLRDSEHLGTEPDEYGWGLQSTEYALLMLPLARYWGADFILFGNEQTAAVTYRDKEDRWTVHPCYDQSHDWTRHIDAMTSQLTDPYPVRTGSLIEPLMDLMVQRILVKRYPRYAALQMSCFAEGEAGRDSRWCHECDICAKMYLMCVASGVDPSMVGFRRSMLKSSDRRFFTLLGGSSRFPYSRTSASRDEQLFAFSLAAGFGSDEALVREFRNSPLRDEALERGGELLDRFVSIHSSDTVPSAVREQTLKIFQKEIADFRRCCEAL
ncbi:MAG: hypothetical protein P1P77_02495 [Spirochaetaceae bacterium]|nr:hypothetical protein [Spirochaetaceae bacterium]